MKLGTTIALCAASAVGTAIALNKATGGIVRDIVEDTLINYGIINDDFDDFDDFGDTPHCTPMCDEDCNACDIGLDKEVMVLFKGHHVPNVVVVPYSDAVNLYEMIEDAVDRLSESASDIEVFGDKAISFERLYDALEEAGTIKKSEPVVDDPCGCGHSEENYDVEDPSKLDPDSGNYEITSKDSF